MFFSSMRASPCMSQTPLCCCFLSSVVIEKTGLWPGLFRLRSVERDFRRHLGEDARVALLEADAHLDGGAVAVGGGNDGDHFAGNVPVRVGVENDGGGLPRPYVGDLAFVDVDLDFEAFHVDQCGDTCAGELAAT